MTNPSHMRVDQALTALTWAQENPVEWVRTALGGDMWSVQKRILESILVNRSTAVASCHSAGKSWLAARAVLWFLYTHPYSVVITTAPGDRQVEGILWSEIRRAHAVANKIGGGLGGTPTLKKLTLDDGWYAWGFTAPEYDPDRFQGFHARYVLLVVDEAAGVSANIFEGMDGIMSSADAHELLIGNPTDPTSVFAKRCKRNGSGEGRQTIHVSAFDTPNFTEFGITEEDVEKNRWRKKITGDLPAPWLVTPQWVAEKFEEWGPASPFYKARVLGQFPDDTEDNLIPMSWLLAAQQRTMERTGPRVLGLDVARSGPDETACYENQGGVVRRVFTSRREYTMATTGRAVIALDETEADEIRVDEIGIGAGVHDRLEELEKPVVGVRFGDAASDRKRFANLKAELYWNEREAYERGERDVDADDEMLAAQATSVRWEPDSKGRIAIETKKKAKSRGVGSPDRFEATVYAGGDVGFHFA